MTSLSYEVQVTDGTAIIWLSGDADIEGIERIPGVGAAAFGNPSVRSVVVDCGAVTFCDSSMLGVLVGWRNQSRLVNCDLRLRAVPPRMMKVLQLTGLDRVFDIG